MKSFNVLERDLDIHHSYLLEASAGTGKTFSIENIVVRLLIEGETPFLLEQLLVVTFTKEAARDLKSRIRSNIEKAIKVLEHHSVNAYDYLKAFLELGEEAAEKAKRRLQNALFSFDQAQIFTIHGFCYRMLREHIFEGDFSCDSLKTEETVSDLELMKIIRDCCPRLSEEVCSPSQLLKVLGEGWDTELLRIIKEGYEIQPGVEFKDYLISFQAAMQDLKQTYGIVPENLAADFELLFPFYKGLKTEFSQALRKFTSLFELNEWSLDDLDQLVANGFYVLNKFALSNKNSKKLKSYPPSTALHYPGFVDRLDELLRPFLILCDENHITARLAFECQKMVRAYLKDHEKFCFSDILNAMLEGCSHPAFLEKIQERYAVAIIDEFQDTDPIQWAIFSRLFDREDKKLYLVGDPKQSIYAFRRADIYTYKEAAARFEEAHKACLDTNFRSEPLLIEALNALFENGTDWMTLPRTQETLSYYPVRASAKQPLALDDGRGNLHFLISQEPELFIPFAVDEIIRLHQQKKMNYNRIAILVKDRRQANVFADECRCFQIPVVLQRQTLLSQSPAILSMIELLKAVLYPKDSSLLKLALGGPLIGWSHVDIQQLDNDDLMEWTLSQFLHLKKQLIHEGSVSFFTSFFTSSWDEAGLTVRQKLLSSQEGDLLLDQIEQIAALIMEHQNLSHCPPEGIVRFLEDFSKEAGMEEDAIKVRLDATKDAVQVITMHSSKGLEFDIVFALGLTSHPPDPSQLVPIPQGITCLLKPVDGDSKEYAAHCHERDAEKMRQLYVAMTRAKHRLYVPVFFGKAKRAKSQAPMEIFLEKIGLNSEEALLSFVSRHENCMGVSILEKNDVRAALKEESSAIQLVEPAAFHYTAERHVMHSYTSLAKHSGISILDEPKVVTAPRIYERMDKSAHTLPAGSETGILLHKLFEMAALRPYKNAAELEPFILTYTKNTQYEGWTAVLSQMVWDVLHADLGGFALKDIDPNKTFREMEFLYPYSQGYMKGVIDFVCEHEGFCYVMDWKSNWLGPTQQHYDQLHMEQSMTEHDYHLQKQIYQSAWERFLKVADKRGEIKFGGILYLFVRGVSADGTAGIYRCQ